VEGTDDRIGFREKCRVQRNSHPRAFQERLAWDELHAVHAEAGREEQVIRYTEN
jgi:hypothetical protein